MEEVTLAKRIERAQAVMGARGVDFLFVAPSSDLIYFFDLAVHASERLLLLIIPQQGKPQMVVANFERTHAVGKEGLVQLHTWQEHERPLDLVRAIVANVRTPTIAVSDELRSGFLVNMLEMLPDANFLNGTGIIRELRMVKDADELAKLAQAAAMADAAWEEFVGTGSLTGKSERHAATELAALRAKHGLEVSSIGICASGPNSAAPHHRTGERIIQPGDSVVFDFGGKYQHYTADVTRTVHIGEPSEEYQRAYATVLRANEAAIPFYRPGVACQDVDRAARAVIEAAGFGAYFSHRLGHGLGLDGHEEPYLVRGNTLPLQAGMVFSDEPGIYIPGRFGIRIEDSVVVREGGGEKINHARRDLVVME
jgi:Xaa-Pro aminopeptidase